MSIYGPLFAAVGSCKDARALACTTRALNVTFRDACDKCERNSWSWFRLSRASLLLERVEWSSSGLYWHDVRDGRWSIHFPLYEIQVSVRYRDGEPWHIRVLWSGEAMGRRGLFNCLTNNRGKRVLVLAGLAMAGLCPQNLKLLRRRPKRFGLCECRANTYLHTDKGGLPLRICNDASCGCLDERCTHDGAIVALPMTDWWSDKSEPRKAEWKKL